MRVRTPSLFLIVSLFVLFIVWLQREQPSSVTSPVDSTPSCQPHQER